MQVDGGFELTRTATIVGYIADKQPRAGLAGNGSARECAEASRWLAFVDVDMHPAFHPLFGPARFISDESRFDDLKQAARVRLRGMFGRVLRQLRDGGRLAGSCSYATPTSTSRCTGRSARASACQAWAI